MTEAEALQYAIDWFRVCPVLPTAKPDVYERHREVIAILDRMRKEKGR